MNEAFTIDYAVDGADQVQLHSLNLIKGGGGALLKEKIVPVFKVDAVDTLGAGDVLHGGFALALAEGRDEIGAMRFGAAVAGLKCSRLGGSAGAPTRAEVEDLLAARGTAAAAGA